MIAKLSTALALVTLSAPLAAQDSPRYYYAGEERIELEVIPHLFTVAHRPPQDGDQAILAALGLQKTPARVSPLTPGVWLVDLGREPVQDARPPSGSAPWSRSREKESPRVLRQEALRRQREVIERAPAAPEVEWAYPALRSKRTRTKLFLTPRIIVGVTQEMDEDRLRSELPGPVHLVRPLRTRGQFLVELSKPLQDDPLVVAAQLREHSWVRWAEPDFIQEWRPASTPDDPLLPAQWHLLNTGQGGWPPGADARLAGAWDVETGDGSVVIAVLDDGVELDHPDLPIFTNPDEIPGDGLDNDGNGLPDDVHGWDFFSGDDDPDPCTSAPCSAGKGSHGTAVAGVAAGMGDNSIGITGACQSCEVLPIRIASHETGAFAVASDVADALAYAGETAHILNGSWSYVPSAAITGAIQQAASNGQGGLGSPVFFATGNFASGYKPFTLPGIPAGTWTFTWTFTKDSSVSAGLDGAWLDNVIFPDGTRETFESCSSLPFGWSSTGDATWTPVDDETRASSFLGGHCAIQAGDVTHNQSSSVSVTRSFGAPGNLAFFLWPSAETTNPLTGGEGPIVEDDLSGPAKCFDFVELTATDGVTTLGPIRYCGTFSNQDRPLQDGTISFPASVPEAIAVGAATHFDRRSDYGQWQASEIDFVCHSDGGVLGITTTDLTGIVGYHGSDYTGSFGGTSSATPLCAGIAGLMLSHDPTLTAPEVRSLLQASTRKIGSLPYSDGRNALYGYGAVSAELALQSIVPGGSIVVQKRTIPGGDPTTFTFTGDLAGSLGDGQQLVSNVAPGTHSTTESVTAGWSLLAITCDDSDSSGSLGTATASFQVAADETVTCVFTNCSDAADTTLDLSGVTITSGQTETFEACDTLTADTFVAQDGAAVTFRAGQTIVLESGVQIGGSFAAVIVSSP